MASIWKHPQSKFWTACFTGLDGRRLKRSTKTTDRKLALKLAGQFEEAARKRRTARQVREVIAGLHREITDEELPTATVGGFINGWFERRRHEVSPATLAFYRGTAGKFTDYLGDESARELAEITREHVTGFRNRLAETLAPRSVNHALKGLRSIFKAARRDGIIQDDPTEFVDTVRQPGEDDQRPFTLAELQAILAVADEEWRSLLRFGLYTGQRLADLATLTWRNVDLARGEIRLVTRKTGRRMLIPIAPPLRKHLESLPAGDEPKAPLHPAAFAVVQRDGRASRLSKAFGELLETAGLRAALPKPSRAKGAENRPRIGRRRGGGVPTFHGLRRTAATLLHEAGIPAAVAQGFIGHDDADTHGLYVNVGREAMEKAAAALPEL